MVSAVLSIHCALLNLCWLAQEREYFAAVENIKGAGAHVQHPVSLPTDVELIKLNQIMCKYRTPIRIWLLTFSSQRISSDFWRLCL